MITALLFSGIIQGGFLIFLLLRKGFNRVSNRILAALIALLISHLSLICLDVKGLFPAFPHFSRLSWLLPLLYGPLILLLIQSVADPTFRFRAVQLGYLGPFMLYFALLLPYFLLPGEAKAALLSNPAAVQEADFGWMNHLTNYVHIGFTVWSLVFFYKSVPRRSGHFSNEALVHMHWLKEFLWLILSIMLFSVLTFYAKKYGLSRLKGIYPAHFVLVVVLVYWIAYKLLQEKATWSVPEEPASTAPEAVPAQVSVKYAKSGLSDHLSQSIAGQLSDYMTVQKPYLDSDLTIQDLSAMLSLPKHQLSQVINTEFGSNFYEFINRHRLEAFKKQVLDPANSHLSILGIALECGFNSKATFNQVFKKTEGMTPSEFVKTAGAQSH